MDDLRFAIMQHASQPPLLHAQVEGGFVQGMGWCCLEELVWGDAAHPWVAPGVLHTRGPGAA